MDSPKNSTKTHILLSVGVVFTLVIYLCSLSGEFKPTPDSAEYIGLGRSIAAGEGYQFNGREGSVYPPMLPLITAGLIKITGGNLPVLPAKLVLVLSAVFLAAGAWRLAGRYLAEKYARLVGLLVLANIAVFQHSMFIMSDVLYSALSIWALVLLDDKKQWASWGAGICFLAAAWLTRSVGMLLAAAVILWLMFGSWGQVRLRGRFLRGACLVLAVGVFYLWKHYYGGSERDYISVWRELSGKTSLPAVIWSRFISMAGIVPYRSTQTLLNVESIGLPLYFTVAVFAVVVLGWVLLMFRRRDVAHWYALLYAGMMSIWYDQGSRFYLPVLPLLLVYGITALKWLGGKIRRDNASSKLWLLLVGGAGVVFFMPLASFIIQKHQLPGLSLFVRGGYIYCLAAGLLLTAGINKIWRRKMPLNLAKMTVVSLLLLYLGMGWMYVIAYASYEHGILKGRGAMLEGYQPYYQMGRWLAEQPNTSEVVFCGHPAIIHLASGRITRHAAFDRNDKNITRQQAEQKIGQQQGAAFLLLESEDAIPQADNEDNQMMREIIRHNPGRFNMMAQGGNDACHYYLYVYDGGALVP